MNRSTNQEQNNERVTIVMIMSNDSHQYVKNLLRNSNPGQGRERSTRDVVPPSDMQASPTTPKLEGRSLVHAVTRQKMLEKEKFIAPKAQSGLGGGAEMPLLLCPL